MKVSIKSFERVVLLGGGNCLLSLVNWCKSEGVSISVVTSSRHSQECLNKGLSLITELEQLSVEHLVTNDIGSSEAKEFLGDLSDAICLSLGASWIFKQETITYLW